MRHLTIIGVATLVCALLTGLAYHLDSTRIERQTQAREQQISEEFASHEKRYIDAAITLLSGDDVNSAFVDEIRETQTTLATESDWRQRTEQFELLVARVRPRVLASLPPELGTDPQSQELRRLQDEMNGALHRRDVLLDRILNPQKHQTPDF